PHPRQRHALLADRHRRLGRPVVLGGVRARCPGRRPEALGCDDVPVRIHDVPGRDLEDAAQLGRGELPERRLLQRGRQGRPLCRLGRARALRDRDPRGVRIAARGEVFMSTTVDTATGIRPFTVEISQEQIDDLRRRIEETRWPTTELVDDAAQGVQLRFLRELARYWVEDYDFGRLEARLNALPQYMTEIDGLGIHFIHVKSEHEGALPLIITHGWPGS